MLVQVKKWGNSASVRIPSSIMASSALNLDQLVDMRSENGRIIIEPVVAPTYDLDELLSRMTSETFHDEVDSGLAIGNEIW
jgi:antitoxin MazE